MISPLRRRSIFQLIFRIFLKMSSAPRVDRSAPSALEDALYAQRAALDEALKDAQSPMKRMGSSSSASSGPS